MSYESNWGFTDPTDEFGVRVAFNDYGSEAPTKEDNEFLVKIRFSSAITESSDCLQDKFKAFCITSDFEPISSVLVSRCLMENVPGSLAAFPLPGTNKIKLFRAVGATNSSSKEISSTIDILKEKFGLDVVLVDEASEEESYSGSLESYENHYDTIIGCLSGAIYHHIIAREEWFAFNIDGQKNGVFAKTSLDGATFLDVIAIKGLTINSEDGSILLRFQTSCCRVTKPNFRELLDNERNSDGSAMPKLPISMVILPTGEEVIVAISELYKGIEAECLKSKANHLEAKSGKAKSDTISAERSFLLTELDVRNRNRGYSLFLPDSKVKCDDYWRLGYGIGLLCDSHDSNGYHLTEVTMELGDQRVIPSQLLASSITAITSRTRRLAQATADAFVTSLRQLPILETVSDPTRLLLQIAAALDSGNDNVKRCDDTTSLSNQISLPLTARFQSALQQKKALSNTEKCKVSAVVLSTRFKVPVSSSLSSRGKCVAMVKALNANDASTNKLVTSTVKRKFTLPTSHEKVSTGQKKVTAKKSQNVIPLELDRVDSIKIDEPKNVTLTAKEKNPTIEVTRNDKISPETKQTAKQKVITKKNSSALPAAIKSISLQKGATVPKAAMVSDKLAFISTDKVGSTRKKTKVDAEIPKAITKEINTTVMPKIQKEDLSDDDCLSLGSSLNSDDDDLLFLE